MPTQPLTLTSPRLTLRPHTRDDFPDSLAMWSDPEVARHIGGKPFTHEEVWARLLRYVGHWTLLGFGYWVVRETQTGRFVGEVGFADFQREIEPALTGTPEIGWALSPAMHGKGYAIEAVQAAVDWADEEWPGAQTACIIAPENEASLRVAHKAGYREQIRTTYKGQPTIMFRRPRRAAA
ncbi:GNAT family N-acetyltransferase [Paraburkholderia phenoliruptrix]|uniref:GNAT family N-acetyltransferase n=1 Tax=Paraburkholderia phenoliruptrix TaxID=252970 RepID=UPI002869EB17|nr:GNAT family N-acetyltransferase [Paraburkholderia phenoliruptrix]WMY11489.1 GNAT family N-acetyltransferase [Paraburkholderia phenoliruptrix]